MLAVWIFSFRAHCAFLPFLASASSRTDDEPMQNPEHCARDSEQRGPGLAKKQIGDRVGVFVGDSRSRRLPCSLKHLSADSSPTTELLTIAETATFLNTSASSIRRLQYGRHIAFIKVGGGVRFAKRDLVAYLEKQRVESLDLTKIQ